MRTSAAVTYLLLFLYAIAVNWRGIKGVSERVMFAGLAAVGFGLLWMYVYQGRHYFAPADWVLNFIGE